MGWAWDFRSVARSSKPMEDGCGRARTLHKVRSFNLRYLLGQGDRPMAGFGTKWRLENVRFSNRPSRVKHFQAIHHFSVDVARGLALLFGLGTMALPSWDSKTRWNNLLRDLAVEVTAGSSGHTNSPHPSSREGHHSTVGWISGFLLFELILTGSHAATSLVHRNSVPST